VVFREKHLHPGIITSTQTFGDLLIWHPHIHCLVTDGAFDAVGYFHPLAAMSNDQATILFQEKVFAMMRVGARLACALLNRDRISDNIPVFRFTEEMWSPRMIGKRWAGWRSMWCTPLSRRRRFGMLKRPAA